MARNLIRALLTLAASAALAAGLAACEKSEPIGSSEGKRAPIAIAGDWSGQLTQEGLKPFLVAVRIDASTDFGNSQVAYTGINCGGVWALGRIRAAEGGDHARVYIFRETITAGAGGNCKGSGRVTLTQDDPEPERLSYVFKGGGVKSTGVLARTDEAGIAPTFAQAGVTLTP